MSPYIDGSGTPQLRVPRASGDEPGTVTVEDAERQCSPRERG